MKKRNPVRAGATLSMLFALSLTACTAPVGDDQGSEDSQVDGTDVELAIADSLTAEKLDELVAKYGECPKEVAALNKTTTVMLVPAKGTSTTTPLMKSPGLSCIQCHTDGIPPP